MWMEMIQAKGLKNLNNIKTMWISMLAPFKQVHNEYKTFMIKMINDGASSSSVKTNYELLCSVEIIMGLTYVLSTLYKKICNDNVAIV
jgi:predicted restriction endonuclease